MAIRPLPFKELLGASSVRERNQILEAVVRSFATNQTRKYFIGFEEYVDPVPNNIYHDPSRELLKKLRDLHCVEPFSAAKWGKVWTGSDEDVKILKTGPIYLFWIISMQSANEATLHGRITSGFFRGSQVVEFRIIREGGKWRTIEQKRLHLLG